MQKATLIAILRQIIIDMTYQSGYQVNTFSVVDAVPDLNHPAFGSTFEDYQSGTFWARTFASSGANQNNLKAEYPALFFEQREGTLPDPYCPCYDVDFYLLVVDMLKCEACPKNISRTTDQVQANALAQLRAIIAELYTYKKWDNVTDGVEQWLSDGRADYLRSIGKVLSGPLDTIDAYLGTGEIKFWEWGVGMGRDLYGYYAKLSIQICEPIGEVLFNYNKPTSKQLAAVVCC